MNTNPIMERDLNGCEFVREQIKPPAREGMDATKIRTYKMAEVIAVFQVPAGTEFDTMVVPNLGEIMHCKVHGVDVHFHGNLFPLAGASYNCKAEVFVKTVERCGLGGEELRQGWRNYYYFIDVRLIDEIATKELVIHNTTARDYTAEGRQHNDQVFDGHFCHVSGDDRMEWEKRRNTHIEIRNIFATDKGRKPRRETSYAR